MISNNEQDEVQTTSTGIPIRNVWYMLLYAWKSQHLKERWNSEIENAPNIDCLLASVLAEQIQQRIRIGLGRDYNKIENEIYGIRGRIDFNKSIKSMSFPQGLTYSRYQIYIKNVMKNQIIRSTLSRMITVGNFGIDKNKAKNQINKLRCTVQELEGIDFIDLKPAEIRREQLKQKDMDYRIMLSLCHLLFLRLMPMEKRGKHTLVKVRRDELTLHKIYEQFIAEFYKHHLIQWDVHPQSILYWPSAGISDFLPVMKPDVILENKKTKQIIILDTKFTKESIVKGQWGNLTFDRNHLFQIYSYLKTQENISEYYRKSTGLLLYPTIINHLSQAIDIQGHKIRWESINLAQPWKKIESDLLALIDDMQQVTYA
jgi:5-methylcytosine-specific restriction enzyme subunit McrC